MCNPWTDLVTTLSSFSTIGIGRVRIRVRIRVMIRPVLLEIQILPNQASVLAGKFGPDV